MPPRVPSLPIRARTEHHLCRNRLIALAQQPQRSCKEAADRDIVGTLQLPVLAIGTLLGTTVAFTAAAATTAAAAAAAAAAVGTRHLVPHVRCRHREKR